MSSNLEVDNEELETIDIETPLNETQLERPQPDAPYIPSPRKDKKNKSIAIVLIVIAVLLIGAGAFYWFVLKEQPTNETSSTTTPVETEVVVDTTDYAKEIIEKVRVSEEKLVAKYPDSKVADGEQPYAPAYRYGTANYYVGGEFGHNLTITKPGDFNEAFNTASEEAATVVLDKERLNKAENEYSFVYSNNNVVCSLSHASYPVNISCANIRDYAVPAEEAAPYAKAYFKAEVSPGNQKGLVFGSPKVSEKSDGYKSSVVSIGVYEGVGGFAGLFYSKDGSWVFWRGTQSAIDCKDYDSYILQKSFEGDACYLDAKTENSVVTVTIKQ